MSIYDLSGGRPAVCPAEIYMPANTIIFIYLMYLIINVHIVREGNDVQPPGMIAKSTSATCMYTYTSNIHAKVHIQSKKDWAWLKCDVALSKKQNKKNE